MSTSIFAEGTLRQILNSTIRVAYVFVLMSCDTTHCAVTVVLRLSVYRCKFVVYQQRVMSPHLSLILIDSADDLFVQQSKKSKKGSAKKDAIEDVFDNDNDDFLDAISKKGSTSSDTACDKNEPTGPADDDDAPVDMVCVFVHACVCV